MELLRVRVLEAAAARAKRVLQLHRKDRFCCSVFADQKMCPVGLKLFRDWRRAVDRWTSTQQLRELAKRPRVYARGTPAPASWTADQYPDQLRPEWSRGTWSSRRWDDARDRWDGWNVDDVVAAAPAPRRARTVDCADGGQASEGDAGGEDRPAGDQLDAGALDLARRQPRRRRRSPGSARRLLSAHASRRHHDRRPAVDGRCDRAGAPPASRRVPAERPRRFPVLAVEPRAGSPGALEAGASPPV